MKENAGAMVKTTSSETLCSQQNIRKLYFIYASVRFQCCASREEGKTDKEIARRNFMYRVIKLTILDIVRNAYATQRIARFRKQRTFGVKKNNISKVSLSRLVRNPICAELIFVIYGYRAKTLERSLAKC